MKLDDLIRQLELYSNGIVGFLVAQSIVFAFTFGTSQHFQCTVVLQKPVAYGLIAHFAISTTLAVVALEFLSRHIRKLSSDNSELVRKVFLGKTVAVALFALIPMSLLVGYGVPDVRSSTTCVVTKS